MIDVTINGKPCEARPDATLLAVAAANGVYIPTLCHHPDLPPFHDLPAAAAIFRGPTCHDHEPVTDEQRRRLEGCGLCVVEVEGRTEPVRACHTPVSPGLSIRTDTDALGHLRRDHLMSILATHPHACLTCAQREGCSLEDCSTNVPKEERCCSQFHNCELRKVAEYVGIKGETPRYRPARLAVLDAEPLIVRDFNLCIDCSRCVRVCNEVRGVNALGLVHDGRRLLVGSVAPTLIDSACKFCGACVEVCPTGCLTDKETPTGDREQWLVPCVGTCSAAVDVPGYIRRIAAGDLRGAAALVWERLPLANVLGHICFHDCEPKCRRGDLDEPIAICALKRFAMQAGDAAILRDAPKPASTGKKVAIVGAGPAGLTAAYFLRFKGHGVTIFESAQAPGGMPLRSVPQYRLPQAVIDRDVGAIRDLGVEIKTGCRLESDHAMVALLDEGFDAVLIAVGLPKSKKIPLEGSNLGGVLWGLEFLEAVKEGKPPDVGGRVVIIGGGNVAIDVAMTAIRLAHAANRQPPVVSLFCLESRDEMPAHPHEIARAEAEGILIQSAWGPAAILGSQGRVSSVEFRRCIAAFDERRKFAPTFDEQQRTRIDADAVILAIGQAPPDAVPAEREGILLAGDIATGAAAGGSVVQAVASGRAAAERIDLHLGGNGDLSVRLAERKPLDPRIGRDEHFAPSPRVSPPCADPQQRRTDFRQIEATYTTEQAVAEAKRCLQCDLRLMISEPPLPPEDWIALSRPNVEQVPDVEGVFILADADKKPITIKGTENVRAALLDRLDDPADARFFQWEEDRMFTKRESELIQEHLEKYGELPGGGDDELDDLF